MSKPPLNSLHLIVKPGNSSMILWGCFSFSSGKLHRSRWQEAEFWKKTRKRNLFRYVCEALHQNFLKLWYSLRGKSGSSRFCRMQSCPSRSQWPSCAMAPSRSSCRSSWGSVTGREQVRSWQTQAVAAPSSWVMEDSAGRRWHRKLSGFPSVCITTCRGQQNKKQAGERSQWLGPKTLLSTCWAPFQSRDLKKRNQERRKICPVKTVQSKNAS